MFYYPVQDLMKLNKYPRLEFAEEMAAILINFKKTESKLCKQSECRIITLRSWNKLKQVDYFKNLAMSQLNVCNQSIKKGIGQVWGSITLKVKNMEVEFLKSIKKMNFFLATVKSKKLYEL